MRFASKVVDGFQVFAVAGTHTASFGIVASDAAKKGLLGFAVEQGGAYVENFKVFKSVVANPTPAQTFSSNDQPIQSFVWDSFTLDPGKTYTFVFHPIRGTPAALDRTAAPISLELTTEVLGDPTRTHEVYFNRGVASSQAYATKFHNKAPDDQGSAAANEKAFQWLSRGLEEAILAFIGGVAPGETLRCCFYEFHYADVLDALAKAITRGVDVKIIFDAKQNAASSPRTENLAAIAAAKIPVANLIEREARKNDIAHNKFMVRIAATGAPSEVWTGSTNISENGIFGQTNVGHWIRDATVANTYNQYWQLLATDPGKTSTDSAAAGAAKNKAFYEQVEALSPLPNLTAIPTGTTPIFSPRPTIDALTTYAKLVADSAKLGAITLAFGVTAPVRAELVKNTSASAPTFLLLETADKSTVTLNKTNNVYEASGSYLKDALYKWTEETNMLKLGIADHVVYIHTKFLLHDPLGEDPIVVTGSANFSEASTKDGNDENMVIIRGDRSVADTYFTEFNRLFYHYYFRSVVDAVGGDGNTAARFLTETDSWTADYAAGTLRAKRVDAFRTMYLPTA